MKKREIKKTCRASRAIRPAGKRGDAACMLLPVSVAHAQKAEYGNQSKTENHQKRNSVIHNPYYSAISFKKKGMLK